MHLGRGWDREENIVSFSTYNIRELSDIVFLLPLLLVLFKNGLNPKTLLPPLMLHNQFSLKTNLYNWPNTKDNSNICESPVQAEL